MSATFAEELRERQFFSRLTYLIDSDSRPSQGITCALRPPRRMPSALKVVQHWAESDFFVAYEDDPACFRCLRPRPVWNALERAHLVNRCARGLDNPSNLVMLCRTCHRVMPFFDADEWHHAVNWVRLELAEFVYLEEPMIARYSE